MPAKKSGTRKSSTIQLPKPMEHEIVVQDPPKSLEREYTASSIEGKDLTDIIDDPEDTPLLRTRGHLYRVLHELQKVHDNACKTNAAVITMERDLFATIATRTQQA